MGIFGPVAGLVGVYLAGALWGRVGRWLGGRGSNDKVMIAFAWSMVPAIWTLPLWIPKLMLFGPEAFTRERPQIDADATLKVLARVFAVVDLSVLLWQAAILHPCLGEAHGFSVWRALGTTLLGGVLAVGILLGLVLIVLSLGASLLT